MRLGFLVVVASWFMVACAHNLPPSSGKLSDSIAVMALLNQQLSQWHGTPYRYGGLDQNGVDCAGFVYRTFKDRFGIQLPRMTKQQSDLGVAVDRDQLIPGDLVFFKTGAGENGLHVGIYDKNKTFLHASTSKGVMRSSLDNVYWRKVYWKAKRL